MRLAISLEHSCRIRSRTLAQSARFGNRPFMRQNGTLDKCIFGAVCCIGGAFALFKAAKKTDCGHWVNMQAAAPHAFARSVGNKNW